MEQQDSAGGPFERTRRQNKILSKKSDRNKEIEPVFIFKFSVTS